MATRPMPRVPRPAPPPAWRPPAPAAAPPIPRAVRWAFVLCFVSLAFEIPERSIPFEIPTVTTSLLLLAAGLSPRASFRRIPHALAWFVGYFLAFVAAVAVNGAENPFRTTELLLLVVQVILLFWIAYNVLVREPMSGAVLWAFALGCALSAGLPMMGIGRTASSVYVGGERLSVFGQNPNRRAFILAAGLLVLIGLIQRRTRGSRGAAILAWSLVALLTLAIVQTGSRAGLLAAGAGLLVYAFAGRTLGRRVQHTSIVLLALGGLLWAGNHSEVMRNRLRIIPDIEQFSGRERIFPAAWALFQERPGIGWGPINNQYEVALRLNEPGRPSRDTHNLVLELLTATGLLGAVPYLIGVALCVRGAWHARHGPQGRLPLALAVMVLAASMSANHSATKLVWLVLAYGLAAGHLARRGRQRGEAR